VLDASVGVKWFRDEPGSLEARALLAAHGSGELEIVVASAFVYEIMAVATRTPGIDAAGLWERFLAWRIRMREVDGPLLRETLDVCGRLDCSLYDAVAPALAEEIGAVLYSADRGAHGKWPSVELIG
jgi:predicted nucleic acid-binding protein